MPSVTLFPGSVSTTNNGNATLVNWTNATNVEAEDAAVASVSLTTSAPQSYFMLCKNYNFAGTIPSTATILGIQVGIKKSSSSSGSVSSNIVDGIVQLIYGAGTLPTVGSSKGDTTTVWPGSLTYEYYGSSADLWSWGSADATHILDSSFGVAVSAHNTGSGDGTANIDAVPITVWYATTLLSIPLLTGGHMRKYGIRSGGRLLRQPFYSFPSRAPGVSPDFERIRRCRTLDARA